MLWEIKNVETVNLNDRNDTHIAVYECCNNHAAKNQIADEDYDAPITTKCVRFWND